MVATGERTDRFAPLAIAREGRRLTVTGATFRYRWSVGNGLLESIRVLGQELLPRGHFLPDLWVSNQVDPRRESFRASLEKRAHCKLVRADDSQVVLEATGTYRNNQGRAFPLKRTIRYTLDFDGVLTVEVTNRATKEGELRWLCFSEGTVRWKLSEFLVHLADLRTTEGTQSYTVKRLPALFRPGEPLAAGRFIPWFHIGNDHVGLDVVVADGDQVSWGRTYNRLYPGGDALGRAGETVLVENTRRGPRWRLWNIRSLHTHFRRGWSRTNTFYLAPVPGKSYTGEHMYLRVHWEGPHQWRKDYQYPSEEKIRTLAQEGIDLIVGCANWRSGDYSHIDNAAETRRVIDTCHKYGIKLIPYVTFNDFNFGTKAFHEHGEDWQIEPVVEFGYRTNLMCPGAAGWREHWEREVAAALDRFDFDGLYIDWWSGKLACRNQRHGCGHGYMSFALPGVREMARFAHHAVRARKPDGFILSNTNVFPAAMVNNFLDVRLLGEWANIEETDPDFVRVFHNAHRLGSNNLLLTGRVRRVTPRSVAFQFLSAGSMVIRRRDERERQLLLGYANALVSAGIRSAEPVTPFVSSEVVDVRPRDCAVGIYRTASGDILLTLANRQDTAQEARLRMTNPRRVGLLPQRRYLPYWYEGRKLLGDGPQKGSQLLRLRVPLARKGPALVILKRATGHPQLLLAENAHPGTAGRWNQRNRTLTVTLNGVEGAPVEVTLWTGTRPSAVEVTDPAGGTRRLRGRFRDGLLRVKATAGGTLRVTCP